MGMNGPLCSRCHTKRGIGRTLPTKPPFGMTTAKFREDSFFAARASIAISMSGEQLIAIYCCVQRGKHADMSLTSPLFIHGSFCLQGDNKSCN